MIHEPTPSFTTAQFLRCGQCILVGQHLELLESLRHPLVHLQELLHTVQRAFVLLVGNASAGELVHAIDKAQLRELVVRQQEIGERFDLILI